MRSFKRLCVGVVLTLPFGAGVALAQVTTQAPADYSAEEAAAAAVVVEWVRATAEHDLPAAMIVINDDIMVRPDPARQMAYGAAAQCASYPFTRMVNSFVRLDELYVVGGPLDSLVLHKRVDINGPASPGGGGGGFGGFPVEVAALARVSNGQITEWLDAPTVRIGGLVTNPVLGQPPAGTNITEACMPYLEGTGGPPEATPVLPEFLTFGTAQPERYWNVEEIQAAQTIRAWFGAWQAGDPVLLGNFADPEVVFRTKADMDIVKGRDALLPAICGTVGDQRLTELFLIGGDFDTLALTESIGNDGTRTASLFRVQNSLVTEWLSVVVEAGTGPAVAADPAACEAVDAALAAAAAAAAANPFGGGGPPPAGAAPGGAPAGAPPAGAPPA